MKILETIKKNFMAGLLMPPDTNPNLYGITVPPRPAEAIASTMVHAIDKIINYLFLGSYYLFYLSLAVVILPIIGYFWYARHSGGKRWLIWLAFCPLIALIVLMCWFFFMSGLAN